MGQLTLLGQTGVSHSRQNDSSIREISTIHLQYIGVKSRTARTTFQYIGVKSSKVKKQYTLQYIRVKLSKAKKHPKQIPDK